MCDGFAFTWNWGSYEMDYYEVVARNVSKFGIKAFRYTIISYHNHKQPLYIISFIIIILFIHYIIIIFMCIDKFDWICKIKYIGCSFVYTHIFILINATHKIIYKIVNFQVKLAPLSNFWCNECAVNHA